MSHELTEAFHQYARNRRWGTCAECPKDGEGAVLPELCVNTTRYDHLLELTDLVRAEQRQLQQEAKATA